MDTMEVGVYDHFFSLGKKIKALYNMIYSNQYCEVKSFWTYTNYLY
jgi:hypothetical protein